MIAELIAWVATVFRCVGMFGKTADAVKYLVSIGNLLWMLNGILTRNTPLVVSNGVCLAVMVWEIVAKKIRKE